MADESIAIRGIREGLLVTIRPDGSPWSDRVGQLLKRIDDQGKFFKGARIALDVDNRPVLQHELDTLRVLLSRREIKLWAVISSSDTTQNAAQHLGLETSLIAEQEQLETTEDPQESG